MGGDDSRDGIGVEAGHPVGDRRAHVFAVHQVALVAEMRRHEEMECAGDAFRAERHQRCGGVTEPGE